MHFGGRSTIKAKGSRLKVKRMITKTVRRKEAAKKTKRQKRKKKK